MMVDTYVFGHFILWQHEEISCFLEFDASWKSDDFQWTRPIYDDKTGIYF